MKRLTMVLIGAIALALTADTLTAQPPDGRGPRPGQRPGGPDTRQTGGRQAGGQQPGGMAGRGPDQGFRPPMMPLMRALDADGDGELSAEEIENATAALKKLDTDKDGKLTRDELRPQFGRPGGQGDFRGPGRGGPGGEGDSRGPGRGGPAAGGRGQERPGGGNFVERLMGLDEDGDGKVSKDELPERMQRILDRADANKDGAIDRAEAEKMAEQFERRGAEQPRGAGQRRDADRGPAEAGGEGQRRGRPARPE